MHFNFNKTGLRPVSRPVKQFLEVFPRACTDFKQCCCHKISTILYLPVNTGIETGFSPPSPKKIGRL